MKAKTPALLEAFNCGKDAFREALYFGEEHIDDHDQAIHFLEDLATTTRTAMHELDHCFTLLGIKSTFTPEWEAGFAAGYMTAYIEYAHLGLHQDIFEEEVVA